MARKEPRKRREGWALHGRCGRSAEAAGEAAGAGGTGAAWRSQVAQTRPTARMPPDGVVRSAGRESRGAVDGGDHRLGVGEVRHVAAAAQDDEL